MKGEPHNKFTEYGTIKISKELFDQYLNNHLAYYTSGTIRYGVTRFTIPAEVFTNEEYLDDEGNFDCTYDENDDDILIATAVIGFTIFWKRIV
mgnify:CR=1 FL=1